MLLHALPVPLKLDLYSYSMRCEGIPSVRQRPLNEQKCIDHNQIKALNRIFVPKFFDSKREVSDLLLISDSNYKDAVLLGLHVEG